MYVLWTMKFEYFLSMEFGSAKSFMQQIQIKTFSKIKLPNSIDKKYSNFQIDTNLVVHCCICFLQFIAPLFIIFFYIGFPMDPMFWLNIFACFS